MVGYGVAILAGAVVALLRQTGVPATDSVWAEDARFLADALRRPFLEVLVEPVAGYLHLTSRLLAEAATHLPLRLGALTMSGGSALATSLIAAFVYRSSSAISDRRLRFALGASVLLLPAGAHEALNNAANLHWFLVFATFSALIWVPSDAMGRLLAASVTGVAALADPLVLLLAPVVLARLLAVRGWHNHWVVGTWVAGLAVQFLVAGGTTNPTPFEALPADVAALYGARVVALNVLGMHVSERLWSVAGLLLPATGLLVAAGFVAYTVTRPVLRVRPVVLLAIVSGGVIFLVTHLFRWSDAMRLGAQWSELGASRYLVVPSLLLITAVVLVLDERDPRVSPRTWSRLVGVVVVWAAVVAASSYAAINVRELGPRWSQSVERATSECLADPLQREAVIEVAPPGWSIAVDCSRLRGV